MRREPEWIEIAKPWSATNPQQVRRACVLLGDVTLASGVFIWVSGLKPCPLGPVNALEGGPGAEESKWRPFC